MKAFGNAEKTEMDCRYLEMVTGEYVREITFGYSSREGLNQVEVVSSLENKLKVGLPSAAAQTKTLQFNESYQFIGLKGLDRPN